MIRVLVSVPNMNICWNKTFLAVDQLSPQVLHRVLLNTFKYFVDNFDVSGWSGDVPEKRPKIFHFDLLEHWMHSDIT